MSITKIVNYPDKGRDRFIDFFKNAPRLIGQTVYTKLTADVLTGATSLPVSLSDDFKSGQSIRVGNGFLAETRIITIIPDSTHITIDALVNDHVQYDMVIIAPGAGLSTAYLDQVQQIEDVFFEILNGYSLDDAIGQQLDNLGKTIGYSRPGGLSDTGYRADLRAWIQWLLSQGEINRLLFILKALTDSTVVTLHEAFPGAAVMTFDGVIYDAADPDNPVVGDGMNLADKMEKAAAAGVRLDVVYDPAGSFTWDDLTDTWDAGLWAVSLPLP